jgi:hypothetical protein
VSAWHGTCEFIGPEFADRRADSIVPAECGTGSLFSSRQRDLGNSDPVRNYFTRSSAMGEAKGPDAQESARTDRVGRCSMRTLKIGLVVLVGWGLLVATGAPAMSEPQSVRASGRVQWIAGDKMMVVPDSGGVPFNVDISRVPQDQYAGLTAGYGVVVNGVVSSDGRWLIASAVTPTGAWEERVADEQVTLRPTNQ